MIETMKAKTSLPSLASAETSAKDNGYYSISDIPVTFSGTGATTAVQTTGIGLTLIMLNTNACDNRNMNLYE